MDTAGYVMLSAASITLPVSLIAGRLAYLRRTPRSRLALLIPAAHVGVLFACVAFVHRLYFLDEALIRAVMADQRAQVIGLLAKGASPNAKWFNGLSALDYAKVGFDPEVTKIISDAGGKVSGIPVPNFDAAPAGAGSGRRRNRNRQRPTP